MCKGCCVITPPRVQSKACIDNLVEVGALRLPTSMVVGPTSREENVVVGVMSRNKLRVRVRVRVRVTFLPSFSSFCLLRTGGGSEQVFRMT